jgi:ABC-type nitrate/sulfonate/bicarbonate transport system substrate-binding protein
MILSRRRSITVLAALPWTACSRRQSASSTVRVVAMPYFNMASLYLADESGYFAGQGLRIDIQEIDRSQVAMPLLAGGKADAAFFGINPTLINAVHRGARVRIAAGRYVYTQDCPAGRRFWGSQKAFPNGFNDLRQMKGKKACLGRMSIGSTGPFIWEQCLAAAGLTSRDVELLDLNDFQAAAALLATGKVDVLLPTQEHDIGLTPLYNRIVPGPAISLFLPNFMYSYITFGKRFLDDSPDEGKRFLKAYFQGARDFLAGKSPKFLDRIEKQDGLDPGRLRAQCRDGIVLDGHIQLADLQRFIDWLSGKKLLLSPPRAEQLVDTRFANATT